MVPDIINAGSADQYIDDLIRSFNEGRVAVPLEQGDSYTDASKYRGYLTEDDRFIIQTSGSTGTSKGVVLGKEALMSNAYSLIKVHQFGKGDIHASCLPLNHVNALCMSVITIHLAGAKLEYYEGKDMAGYMEFIDRVGARTATIVPALLEDLCEVAPEWPECLEYLITAAAPLSSELAGKFYELYGSKLVQGYGLSEGVNFSFTMPKVDDDTFVKEYIDNYPPVGLPLDDVEFCFSDEGEVLINSKSVFSRYHNEPERVDKVFTYKEGKRWLRTGDIGHVRNGYLVLDGRIKEVINRGGETIYPRDIENKWREQGMEAIAFPVKSKKFYNEIGMACSEYPYRPVTPEPSAIIINSDYYTSTGKPQRLQMGKDMQSFHLSKRQYQSMINSAHSVAEIFKGKLGKTLRARKFIASAEEFLRHYQRDDFPEYYEPIFGWMKDNAEDIISGKVTGETFINNDNYEDGWEHLMNNLMGIYPVAMKKIIHRMGITGKVLELGSGVGNLTKLIQPTCEIIPSDLSVKFINKYNPSGNAVRIDFNEPFDIPDDVEAVVACNALHCAQSKYKTLKYIHNEMSTGAHLILGEGEKFVNYNRPWPFDFVFQLFEGWYDNSGFIPEDTWVSLLTVVGFKEIKVNRIRSGSDKLGAVICGVK